MNYTHLKCKLNEFFLIYFNEITTPIKIKSLPAAHRVQLYTFLVCLILTSPLTGNPLLRLI